MMRKWRYINNFPAF